MKKIADSWNMLCRNAEKFHLDLQKFNLLEDFYTRLDKDIFRKYAALVTENFPMARVQELFSGREFEMFLLLCIVANYGVAAEKYRKEGWPAAMRDEILADLRTWVDTLEADLTGYGLIPRIFFWCSSCLKGEVKSFGRLQCNSIHGFQAPLSIYRQLDGTTLYICKAYQRGNPPTPDLAPGDKVINLHIPARGALDRSECIRSIRRMCDFSAKYYPDYRYRAVVCYSWLLDPQFQKLLAPDSNIVRFQNLGHLCCWEEHGQDAEIRWRLWGNKGNELRLEQLSSDTSLRRAVLQTLQSGGHFSEGVLVIFRDELPRLFAEL